MDSDYMHSSPVSIEPHADFLDAVERFIPPTPTTTPRELFIHGLFTRLVGGTVTSLELLIYTDGSCSNNGAPGARAGCAFIFRPSARYPGEFRGFQFRLEKRGPDGEVYPQTNNRAELRAVIGALTFRAWHGEGFKKIVIATDSSYVVHGITEHIRLWLLRDWRNSEGTPVRNIDLWKTLLGRVAELHECGVKVSFWLIPREWNSMADAGARLAVMEPDSEYFTQTYGVGF